MNLNLTNLVEIARNRWHNGDGIKCSSWRAVNHGLNGYLEIYHYATLMMIIHDDDTITPISKGWGSMSDKKGVRTILTNVTGQGYAEVYKDFV
jgi:hypothetical protein